MDQRLPFLNPRHDRARPRFKSQWGMEWVERNGACFSCGHRCGHMERATFIQGFSEERLRLQPESDGAVVVRLCDGCAPEIEKISDNVTDLHITFECGTDLMADTCWRDTE